MKKYCLSFVFLSFLSLQILAQSFLVQVKAGSGKWGYSNLKGELVIPAQYERCEPFSDNGLTFVTKNEIPFIINTKGEEIPTEISGFAIQGLFTTGSRGFSNGLIAVTVNEKWGYLNEKGKLAIPLKYDYVTTFESGFAAVKIGTSFFVLDTLGNEIPVPPGIRDMKRFSEGLAPFESADKKNGFLNGKGQIAIAAEYNGVGYFCGPYAWAKRASDKKIGFINAKGEWVIQPSFEGASDLDPESKMACVKEGNKWLYVDVAGNKMDIKTPYNSTICTPFSEGLAAGWVFKTDKVGFFNTKGESVIEAQFTLVRNFKNGYAAVKMGFKWGIIDRSGNWVIKPMFDGMKDVEYIN